MINKLKKIAKNCTCLTSVEDIYAYCHDTSPEPDVNMLADIVILPNNVEDIQKIVKFCNENRIAVIARGAGTCHTGGCRVKRKPCIILHLSKLNKIIKIDKENLIAKVQPNVVLGDFQKQVEDMGLFFPPDPSNLKVSTIGGAISLNSGGPRTFKYGNTKDYVINLKVVLPNGEIMETSSDIAKDVTGYNLTQLFVGSEGTLGIIVEATLKLIVKPEQRLVTLAYFDKLEHATSAVNAIINNKMTPSTVDLLDKNTIETIEKYNPTGLLTNFDGALLIEIDGNKETIKKEQEDLSNLLKENNAKEIISAKNNEENEKIWRARRSAFGSVAKLKPDVITEDVVVPRDKIVPLVEGIKRICKNNNVTVCIMGHVADGNIHPNFALDLEKEKDIFNKTKDELFELALSLGGTLSGEHGIGYEKKKYLNKALDQNAYKYMEKIKILFDPNNIMNPDKMF
ncbi:MAG: FAD-binding protein [Cyanobacteria bacterium SIG30]|nr:FAD-binding protein [Cyanobacteria bacterium SIG30]